MATEQDAASRAAERITDRWNDLEIGGENEIAAIIRAEYEPVIRELVEACKAADEELCRASFPGPRDKRGINDAINQLRAVLAKHQ